MTKEQMKEIINNEVPFSDLQKNKGIFEFHFVMNEVKGYEKSIGISYEDIDDETDVYIYNIFLGDEYINISNRGTKENPIPDEVIQELIDEWNLY